jgi:predicted nucleic acid-binding protein
MILVDTSVWVDHLRKGDDDLVALLNGSQVLIHPFVIGELACGNLVNRGEVLGLLKHLPCAQVASDDEVLHFIEQQSLMGQGIAYIDAHLLAAVALDNGASLWTRDVRLQKAAKKMSMAWRKK